MQHLADGELDGLGAVRYAAMHGWAEGHLKGERCHARCVDGAVGRAGDGPDGPWLN